jgi:hypothetical protein
VEVTPTTPTAPLSKTTPAMARFPHPARRAFDSFIIAFNLSIHGGGEIV